MTTPFPSKRKVVYEVDYYDLENFIKEQLGCNVEVCWESNDSYELYELRKPRKQNIKPGADYLELKNRKLSEPVRYSDGRVMIPATLSLEPYDVYTFLQGLCNEGKLKPGRYLVAINW